jgi:MraZ protein
MPRRHPVQRSPQASMSLFLATHINKIDKKGRVSVPAGFRATLAKQTFQGVVLFRSLRTAAIEGCGMNRMERLSSGMDDFTQFSGAQNDLAASIFADALPLSFDAEGRILLTPDLIAHAQLDDAAAFVGCGPTFQIWQPAAFKAHQAKARARVQSQELGIRLTKGQPQEETKP